MAERKTEFTYGLVNSADVKKINFVEELDGEVLAQDNVLILMEEQPKGTLPRIRLRKRTGQR